MKIFWHGNTQITIHGQHATVSIDGPQTTRADIYLYSKPQEEKNEVEGTKIFDWPGEYESKGVSITMISGKTADNEENLIAYMEIDHTKICHLCHLGKEITAESLKEISETDILFVPIGGGKSFNSKKAHEIIEQIEPRVVIPINYLEGDESIVSFMKEMGINTLEPVDKYETKGQSQLHDNRTEFVLLKQNG